MTKKDDVANEAIARKQAAIAAIENLTLSELQEIRLEIENRARLVEHTTRDARIEDFKKSEVYRNLKPAVRELTRRAKKLPRKGTFVFGLEVELRVDELWLEGIVYERLRSQFAREIKPCFRLKVLRVRAETANKKQIKHLRGYAQEQINEACDDLAETLFPEITSACNALVDEAIVLREKVEDELHKRGLQSHLITW